ncbi:MAG: AAA family ATPase [Candidatus Vogelbacteria bacterium]|nr:AAA family ATPase [Candidatus Vogelbacteria bacterium]
MMTGCLSLGSESHFGRDFKIIVLTGGPCSGKSTLIGRVKKGLEVLGYWVYTLDEIATGLFDDGFLINAKKDLSNEKFQPFKIEHSLAVENSYVRAIRQSVAPKRVLLLDRGIMDDLLYSGDELFDRVLGSLGLTRVDVRDRRYDAVLHLQTAAALGDKFYTTDNNNKRIETAEGARIRDQKTLECWIGHRHLRFIPAMIDKEAKFSLLWKHVCAILGIPKPLEIERKFLVKPALVKARVGKLLFPTRYQLFNVTQQYLAHKRGQSAERIREISSLGGSMNFNTTKISISDRSREEHEREITLKEYRASLKRVNPKTHKIKKTRTYFMYQGQYFEFDDFQKPYQNLALLEIELLDENDPVNLPPFIKVIREVTDDPRFRNSALAKLSLGTPRRLSPKDLK